MRKSRRKSRIVEVRLEDGGIGEFIDHGLVSVYQNDEEGHVHNVQLSEADLRLLLDLASTGRSAWGPGLVTLAS